MSIVSAVPLSVCQCVCVSKLELCDQPYTYATTRKDMKEKKKTRQKNMRMDRTRQITDMDPKTQNKQAGSTWVSIHQVSQPASFLFLFFFFFFFFAGN